MKEIEKTSQKAASAPPAEAKSRRTGILVVDDHPIVREGLVRVIDQTDDLQVCGEAQSAAQALALVAKARPGLAVVDIALGGRNGLELIKDLKARHPKLPVLVHSMYDESMYAERCLRAGAMGYVMKQESPSALLRAIRTVLAGEVSLSESMTRQLLAWYSGVKAGPTELPEKLLSDRELEVFELLGLGHATKEIAQNLHLSDKTIQTYRQKIKDKLKIPDAIGLVRRATQWVEVRTSGGADRA